MVVSEGESASQALSLPGGSDPTAGGMPLPPERARLPGYQLTFHTSRGCNAGTSAKVENRVLGAWSRAPVGSLPLPGCVVPAWDGARRSQAHAFHHALHPEQACMELLGSRASSGVLPLIRARRAFHPGGKDTFTFPHIPWLGDIRCMRVGTDGTGLFPGWHLRCACVSGGGKKPA